MSDGGDGGAGAPAGGVSAPASEGEAPRTSIADALAKAKAQQAAKAGKSEPKSAEKAAPGKAEAKTEPKQAAKPAEKGDSGKEAPDAKAGSRDADARATAAPAADGGEDAEGAPASADAGEQVQETPKAPADPSLRPPPGWSPEAKAAFAELPPAVQQAVARREAEVDAGFKQYAGLRPYAEMAARSNTSLDRVLGQLSQVEDAIRTDPALGLQQIAAIYGFDLRETMGRLSQSMPEQGHTPVVDPMVFQMQQQLQALQSELQSSRTTTVQSAVQAFASDPANEFWEDVAPEISNILQSDIARYRAMPASDAVKDAYEKAIWLNPDIRERLINKRTQSEARSRIDQTKAATDQARAASKSVTGSPTHGVALSDKPKPKDIRGAIRAAREMVEQ